MSDIINVRNFTNPITQLDKLLIPNEIYNLTLMRDTDSLNKYFINNPTLMKSFIGFNSTLKNANRLSDERKCGCFYTIPWKTKWAVNNNRNRTILLFNLQVEQYKYMIKYWYPSPETSYMRYLSSIALNLLLILKQYQYYTDNNLSCTALKCNKYFNDKFKNNREIKIYLKNLF